MTKLLLDAAWLGNLQDSEQQASKNCLDTWNGVVKAGILERGEARGDKGAIHESYSQGGGSPRSSGLQLLLTESSSSYEWNLPPPAQDSFLHTLFTVAELGQYAKSGVGMVARWAFSESTPFATIRYREGHKSSGSGSMDGSSTYDASSEDSTGANTQSSGVISGSFDVAADYWVLLAHKNAVGQGVLSTVVEGTNDRSSNVLVYASCGKTGTGRANGTVAIQTVNTGSTAATLNLTDSTGRVIITAPRLEWVFTAGAGDDLGTITPTLNGMAEPLKIMEDGALPPGFVPAFIAHGRNVTLPPRSSAIMLLLHAGAAACY